MKFCHISVTVLFIIILVNDLNQQQKKINKIQKKKVKMNSINWSDLLPTYWVSIALQR